LLGRSPLHPPARPDGRGTCLLPVLQADSQSGGVAPTVSTVGFPDSTVRESRDRGRAAIRNAGLAIPVDPITVNLAPTCGR
jgi:predicted ATPase with chaperone activity